MHIVLQLLYMITVTSSHLSVSGGQFTQQGRLIDYQLHLHEYASIMVNDVEPCTVTTM